MRKNDDRFESENFSFQEEVLEAFNDRLKEIELFFLLIHKFEASNPMQLIPVDETIQLINENDFNIINGDVEQTMRMILRKMRIERPEIDLINIFKSNSILLLYNLIESTVSNTNKFILKTISNATLNYSDSILKVKEKWIKYVSKHNKNEYLNTAVTLLDQTQIISFNVENQLNDDEKEFQGNLDPRNIDILLESYGINKVKSVLLTKQNERDAVKNIIQWRNDLAHGKYSFAVFGRDLRYKDTNHNEKDVAFLKESCFEFMAVFLSNVEQYIENQGYKNNL